MTGTLKVRLVGRGKEEFSKGPEGEKNQLIV